MVRFFVFVFVFVFVFNSILAHITITKTQCNYQYGLALVTDEARVGWQMKSTRNDDRQTAYQLIITERITHDTIYNSYKMLTSQSQFVSLPKLPLNKYGYSWRVRVWDKNDYVSFWSSPQDIRVMPDVIDAKWIGAISKKDANIPKGRFANTEFKKDYFVKAWQNVDSLSLRSIIIKRDFTAKKDVVDAIVYVCGLGHYQLELNGMKVGDSEFAPLWSEYSKTVYYNVFDVTSLIRASKNDISVLLGNGFYNVQRGNRYAKLQMSFGAPKLLLRLEIRYKDGSTQIIKSAEGWKYCLSPITFNSIYGGESYDATLENNTPLLPVKTVEAPDGKMIPQTAPPVKVMERYNIFNWSRIPTDSLAAAAKAMKRDSVSPTAIVADMGQNLSGFPEISLSGKRGQKIIIYVGEKLTPQGAVNQRETGRQHYYEYTLKGQGLDYWHPHFSYYGYRYIQVEGAVMQGQPNPDNLPVIYALNSCFVYNSAEEVSTFKCSNDLFNKAHLLIERAERSNMQAVLSDCPHREKLGWLEQDHLNGKSLLYNYDMTSYIPKIIRDITDTQKPNGMVPTTAPQYVSFGNLFDDSPEWSSALIILPFMYYEQYGDSTLITRNYSSMKQYLSYLTSRAENNILDFGLGDWYDYGPWTAGFSKNTPVALVATAHYIYDLQLMQQAAKMVKNEADLQYYSALYDRVVRSFNEQFYHPDSCSYATGSQCANALPLFLGICGGTLTADSDSETLTADTDDNDNDNDNENDNRKTVKPYNRKTDSDTDSETEGVLQSLIKDIEKHGYRLTTGDVGNRYLIQSLAKHGRDDLVYKMFNHYDAPGYGFQLKFGATTLTEQWDPRHGSSWNHFMMGQLDEWLFMSLAGIRQQEGTYGMKHLIIEPKLMDGMTSISASTETLYGKISVAITMTSAIVTIPMGCDAEITLPNGSFYSVGSGTWELK